MTDVDINQNYSTQEEVWGIDTEVKRKKFLKMEKNLKNLNWAEQSAKQSVLYDFTNPDNWTILTKIKNSQE